MAATGATPVPHTYTVSFADTVVYPADVALVLTPVLFGILAGSVLMGGSLWSGHPAVNASGTYCSWS